MKTYILCHKCDGVLAGEIENTPLNICGCISGYVRGFEKILTLEQAKEVQIKKVEEDIEFYSKKEKLAKWEEQRVEWAKKKLAKLQGEKK